MRPERLRKSDVRLLCTLERCNAERPLAFTVQAATVHSELGKTRSELSSLRAYNRQSTTASEMPPTDQFIAAPHASGPVPSRTCSRIAAPYQAVSPPRILNHSLSEDKKYQGAARTPKNRPV